MTGRRALEKQLKKKVRRIDTGVLADNDGAARFCVRIGYRELGGEEPLAKAL